MRKKKNKMTKKINKENGKIDKKMKLSEIFSRDQELAMVLMEKGMHCCGCPIAMEETLEQGAMAHGLNPDELVKELNKKLESKTKKEKKK
jgi:hybrid cluster-associated redox disulfide protein